MENTKETTPPTPNTLFLSRDFHFIQQGEWEKKQAKETQRRIKQDAEFPKGTKETRLLRKETFYPAGTEVRILRRLLGQGWDAYRVAPLSNPVDENGFYVRRSDTNLADMP